MINNIISQLVKNPDMKKSVSSSCIADINVLLLKSLELEAIDVSKITQVVKIW